jgi:photosystem II stability/assembly factor-like uncharacterized protein
MVTKLLLAAGALVATLPATAAATIDSSAVSGLGVRNIGSAQMSGRISAIAGRREKDGKITLFVGAASGGVWKSTDGGTTFEPVFDRQPVQSIGAIALDPKHPDVIWVGTGESWTRNSVSIGNGIYKSTDGGENWTNVGLPNSERITRIVVSPQNGNIVYACVPGKLWSDSADRGLYRTTDGGAHWSLILRGPNLSTGCSSVSMDPVHSNVLFAGLWDFRRKGWTFRSGGEGPTAPSGSALYRSNDGGTTWTKETPATNPGLPKGPWGRVEVAIAPSNPKIVYAFIENVRSALYASSDGGRTWQERDRSQRMVWRPFYFSRLVIDPTDDQRLFKMNLFMIVSDDGGRSFSNSAGGSHGDWHDIWIDPTNSKVVIGGDDGGLWLSYDGGSKWWKGGNLPISQFYHVSVDNKDPYQVYGGLQDNSDWVGDSAYPGGITNERWENLFGGDGFWTFSDPTDPNFTYTEAQGGTIARVNRQTLVAKDIQPRAGYGEKLRWNWNTPIALSPNDPATVYIGAQFLFRTRDHGNTWERISPDLTTNDPEKQKQEESGGITVDNSAAETYTTIYSISESPKSAKVIWVGTDDGRIDVEQRRRFDRGHGAGQMGDVGRGEPLRSGNRLRDDRSPHVRRHGHVPVPHGRFRQNVDAARLARNRRRSRICMGHQRGYARPQLAFPRHGVRTLDLDRRRPIVGCVQAGELPRGSGARSRHPGSRRGPRYRHARSRHLDRGRPYAAAHDVRTNARFRGRVLTRPSRAAALRGEWRVGER